MAVEPPPELVAALRAMDRPVRPGLRWMAEDQWHVTLRFVGTVDPGRLVTALGQLQWAESVVARSGPAPAALSRYVWVLPVDGLGGLAGAVSAATEDLAPLEERPFAGHLTLARAKRPQAMRGLPAPTVTVAWEVTEVVAFRSELRPDRAVHHEIGRFPLGRH